MSVRFDSTPRPVADASNVALTTGVASLGGTIGVAVTIDDAVVTSKADAIAHLQSVILAISKQTWPIA